MAAPSNLTISYGSSSTATVPIPASTDYSTAILNIARAGGFLFTDASGVLTWIPLNQVTKITAT